MERTSLAAGTRGSGRCQIPDGGEVMILRVFVKVKSGDGGCFMKLQGRWGGRRCDGPASSRASMTRFGNCLGYHPNLPSNRNFLIGSMVSSHCPENGIGTGRRALVTAPGTQEPVLAAIISCRRPNWLGRSNSGVKCRRGHSPREHQREGGTRLREAPGLDAALPRARHMFP